MNNETKEKFSHLEKIYDSIEQKLKTDNLNDETAY